MLEGFLLRQRVLFVLSIPHLDFHIILIPNCLVKKKTIFCFSRYFKTISTHMLHPREAMATEIIVCMDALIIKKS